MNIFIIIIISIFYFLVPLQENKKLILNSNFEIIKDAIDINNLCMPEFKGKSSRFIECDKNHLIDALIKEIKKLLKQGFTKKDIAILSPIYNYQTGIDNLNEKLSQF